MQCMMTEDKKDRKGGNNKFPGTIKEPRTLATTSSGDTKVKACLRMLSIYGRRTKMFLDMTKKILGHKNLGN